ncbi:cupin domain-containing protein [uncultured Roseibium sp.]|uniref:cupin domain-containing protein n=1 Tax=uncultured Roseibium sp. TaxID=1936171 RepID=UPI003217CA6D
MGTVHSGGPDLKAVAKNLGFTAPVQDVDQSDAPGLFTQSVLDVTKLKPRPIRPEWILEGQPEARCASLSMSTRGWGSTDHWSCTAGKFRWHYGWDEAVLFLEGEVKITDESGKVYLGQPGVSLFFPAGTSAVWEVPSYIRKIAFNQRPVPLLPHLACRVVDKLRGITGRFAAKANGL